MNGFEIFLCVLAGIILFIILILSIPLHIQFSYSDKIYLSVKYGFIKINILPLSKKEKKPKKEKEPKPEKQKEEKEKSEKEKKPNSIVNMLKANGIDGMLDVISNLNSVLLKFGQNIFKSLKFNNVQIYAIVGTGDAASCAMKYGKTCQTVFPFVGFLCSNYVVKHYDVDISPDFLANSSQTDLNIDFQMVLRKIVNAFFGFIFRTIFKVGLKFLSNAKKGSISEPQKSVNS